MAFEEILAQVARILEQRGKVSLRALRREFALTDDFLEDLRFELVEVLKVATETTPGVLVGCGAVAPPAPRPPPADPAPRHDESRAGTSRAEESRAGTPRAGESHAGDSQAGEVRHLTVMFCDLVESMALSQQLDAEDLREVIRRYQRVAGEAIRKHDGHVAQYLGDGILVYFGYPRAHEDDARRAVRAGREILAALARIEEELERRWHVRLTARIGLHTGHVVVGAMGDAHHREHLAMGVTPNLAARLQAAAQSGQILLSAATHRLVRDGFAFVDLGLLELKGVPAPVRAYAVAGELAPQARLAAAGPPCKLVGRDAEMALLQDRWAKSRNGEGQVVLLCGEPGIGKSRVVAEFRARAERDGARSLVFRCSPYHANSPFQPIADHLREELSFQREETPAAQLARLEQAFAAAELPLDEAIPLFAPLVGLDPAVRYPVAAASPQRQKERRRELFLGWVAHFARRRPVFAVFEDLHWADPSTLALLGLVVEQAPGLRLAVVLTARPEFTSPWSRAGHVSQLVLSRLGRSEIQALVGGLTHERGLPRELLEQIAAKTDGVPLFVEEVTRFLLESGALLETERGFEAVDAQAELSVPTTLQDSLMARLDRLSDARSLAQWAAALGRDFTFELLLAVAPIEDGLLRITLDRLVDAQLLFQHGVPPGSRYTFKHALIQDVAYQSLLKSKRQSIHARIATVLEQRFPETATTSPEWLAHHWTLAGRIERAVPLWRRAGEQALARSALTEAIRQLQKGLELVRQLPESAARDREEARLQICLGAPFSATRGYGSVEAAQAYARAYELCSKLGDPMDLFHSLYGMWRTEMLRAEYVASQAHALDLVRQAQQAGKPSLTIAAHRALGAVSFYMGHLDVTCAQMERVHALTADHPHADTTPMIDVYDIVDPRTTASSYHAWALWLQGRSQEAVEMSTRALALADAMRHPFSQALAMSFATWLAQFRGDVERTRELAAAAVDFSLRQGFLFWVGWGNVLAGWSLARSGEPDEAVPRIHAGLEAWKKQGSQLGLSYFFSLLAEVHALRRDGRAALQALDEARQFSERTGERFWEAERLRLEGEIGLEHGLRNVAEATACFERALTVAREQGAKLLELRAATSLARAVKDGGDRDSARQRLAALHARFERGFHVKDVQDAAGVLAQM